MLKDLKIAHQAYMEGHFEDTARTHRSGDDEAGRQLSSAGQL